LGVISLSLSQRHNERTGLDMSVYGLRVSFDEWVGSQAGVSNDDVANVCEWLKHLVASSDHQVIEWATSCSLAKLVDIVC